MEESQNYHSQNEKRKNDNNLSKYLYVASKNKQEEYSLSEKSVSKLSFTQRSRREAIYALLRNP